MRAVVNAQADDSSRNGAGDDQGTNAPVLNHPPNRYERDGEHGADEEHPGLENLFVGVGFITAPASGKQEPGQLPFHIKVADGLMPVFGDRTGLVPNKM